MNTHIEHPKTPEKAQRPGTRQFPGVFPSGAAPVGLPLAFILTGLLALVIAIAWLVAEPQLLSTYHYNQNIIAVTHLFVLGCICSVVMGAMYQLVPVALETKLYSEKLAWWQFAVHVIGFVGMVWMFRIWNMKQVGHFGSALAFGVALFVYNIARTLRRVPKWTIVATAVSAALVWISLTVTAGLCVAAGKCVYESEATRAAGGFVGGLLHGLRSIAGYMSHFDAISTMHAHAHLGGVGFFTMLIVGVSYKLVPMFTLSEVQSRRRTVCSIALLNFGLVGAFVSILLRSSLKPLFAIGVTTALVIYLWELRAILRNRKRQMLDWGIKYFLTAVGLLLPTTILAAVLSWPRLPLNAFTGQLENAYGFLGFVGVVIFAIIGMLYKIIPFLVWYGKYSSQIGRAQVPALADLYSAQWQMAGYWTWLTGLGLTVIGIIAANQSFIRAGCGLLALSLATLVANVVKMLSHFFNPRLKPLAPLRLNPNLNLNPSAI